MLVDAPCSGWGTLRRNPDLKWRQTRRRWRNWWSSRPPFWRAARLLKSGGRLVYATLQRVAADHEAIAEAFSLKHPDFVPMDAGELLAQLKVPEANRCVHRRAITALLPASVAAPPQTDGFLLPQAAALNGVERGARICVRATV